MNNNIGFGWDGLWNDSLGGHEDYKDMLVEGPKACLPETPILACSASSPKPQQNQSCTFAQFKVLKEKRNFELIVIGGQSSSQIYEVISGCSETYQVKVKASVIGLNISKGDHKNKVIIFNKPYISKSDTSCEFKVAAENFQWKKPWEVQPTEYLITASTCGSSATVKIHVYQDLEINGAIGFDFGEIASSLDHVESRLSTHGKSVVNKTANKEEKEKGLTIEGGVKYDGLNVSLDLAFKDVIEKIKGITKEVIKLNKKLGKIKEQADALILQHKISKKQGNKFSFNWPNIKFSIELKWNEIKGSPQVDYLNQYTVEGSPLVGWGLDVDLVAFLIGKSPFGIAKSLIEEYIFSDLISIRLKIDAHLNGKVKFNCYRHKNTDVEGELQVKVPYRLSCTFIKIEKDGEIFGFAIKFQTELSASIKSFAHIKFYYAEGGIKFVAGNDEIIVVLTGKISANAGRTKANTTPDGYSTVKSKSDNSFKVGGEYELWRSEKFECEPKTLYKLK